MLNITYISNEDRDRLVQLNEELRAADTIEKQANIREEIASIEARRKPLHECDTNECTELRTVIWAKFDRLNRTGKYGHALQFKRMLEAIEIRQMVIHREMALAEQERRNNKKTEDKSKSEKVKKAKDERVSAGKAKSGTATSRWTTGIGSLD